MRALLELAERETARLEAEIARLTRENATLHQEMEQLEKRLQNQSVTIAACYEAEAKLQETIDRAVVAEIVGDGRVKIGGRIYVEDVRR